ncbi:B-cell scaffold protein with ankyrin repeats isoform X2 [Bufo bufo]|uniref:B-cell scaffold protein with ankyrin repeats isoform X2 n=1 Tax=Bufo bufo TaxID=8384 RepID=UPI001ABE6CE0|nr:B-cell scaffold protein with ankyrin repeats isoform X2 [Bufo bufo]
MAEMTKNLLVIYEKSGEEWATYLKELLTSHLQIDDVFLYDVSYESNKMVKDLIGSMWQCKLLVLTKDILKIFCENQSTNFFKLLQPSHRVVLMLCGVSSPEGLYELFPFERDCHFILPDQDPHDYISIVSIVMNEDYDDGNKRSSVKTAETSTWSNIGEDKKTVQPSSVLVLPKRVSCENPGELFIILSKGIPKDTEVEVEFCIKNKLIRNKPKQWSEKILCLSAPDFPPGEVTVNICCGEIITASTQIEYFSTAEDLKHLLLKSIDPVAFICQAFNVYTLEELDKVLMKSLKNKLSSCDHNLHEHRISGSSEEIPTLLHCAAKLGLKEVALLLMQSPAADSICRITNKYGDDPAKMAEKYGHQDIQDIINQLFEKLKANQTDIPWEPVEFEQEDVYVDMVECAAHQQSSKDLINNETDMDAINEMEQKENKEEYVKEYVENKVSDRMLEVTNEYCFLIPADNPSRTFKTDDPCLQDETYKTDKEEEWFISEPNCEDPDWQNTECEQNSKCPYENMYDPMSVYSVTEELPSKEDIEGLNARPPPEQDLIAQRGCFKGEDFTMENTSQGAHDKHPDEQPLNGNDEEPALIASTEDNVYIIFENSIKDTQRAQTHFISHNLVTPEPSSTATMASATSFISQERIDDNELVSHGELDEYSDEVNDHKDNEESLVVAFIEDDAYIVFEPTVKHKQRGQPPFISHKSTSPEAASNSTTESGASYISQEERKDDNEIMSHGELDEFSVNYHKDDEESLIVASIEDDAYIVFEPIVKNKQRGQPPFISHKSASPEAASNITTESGASYIAQAEGIDERPSTQLCWEGYEDNEEDPYSLIYNDDDELYIELPYETAEEENPRERKSFIVHRAPAPAPRPQTTAPDIEDSYISQVFRQKEGEKKIYSTGFHQDKVQLAKHEPQIPAQQYALTGQDELILLQEKVKMGIISMDEALQKFQEWQNEKSGLDILQQKKLQQLRDNIIGNKTDDERVYEKITIVHQPNAFPGKKRTTYGMFDNSIYQKTSRPAHLPTPYHPVKKEMAGKLPHTK